MVHIRLGRALLVWFLCLAGKEGWNDLAQQETVGFIGENLTQEFDLYKE